VRSESTHSISPVPLRPFHFTHFTSIAFIGQMRPNYLRSSDAQTDRVLSQINEKLMQLKNGIGYGDRSVLKTRLQITWGEANEDHSVPAATAWRKSRAREIYTEIGKASEHLFLPVILAITPTDCTKQSINNTLDHLLRIENYEPFHVNLGPAAKKFLETIAIEQGFSGNSGYLKFMRALFPQGWCSSFAKWYDANSFKQMKSLVVGSLTNLAARTVNFRCRRNSACILEHTPKQH
jgi:hypothetical protein